MNVYLLFAIAAGVLAWSLQVQAAPADAIDETTDVPEPLAPDDEGFMNTGTTNGVRDFAQAIAHAEGFGIVGAIPTKAHNPGDLVIPGWTGLTMGAENISVFQDDAEGWSRLYHQLQLVVDNRSHVYTPTMTIAQFAAKWTGTQVHEWIANVLAYLNGHGYAVTSQSLVGEVLNS